MERISYQDVAPGMFDQLMKLEDYIDSSGIDKKLLELIRLRVAQLNGCAYCIDMHHKILRSMGESDLRLSLLTIWKESQQFTELEQAVFQLTDQVIRMKRQPLADSVFEGLSSFYSKPEISLLVLAIAQINTWTILMKSFQFTPGRFEVKNQ